jgi:hypothetical protein
MLLEAGRMTHEGCHNGSRVQDAYHYRPVLGISLLAFTIGVTDQWLPNPLNVRWSSRLLKRVAL